MKNTKKNHEKYLNELYADMYSEEQAQDEFAYLTNRSRGKYTTRNAISVAHANHELGSLLRKFDPIAFECSFNDKK